jgi:hypothetical protein
VLANRRARVPDKTRFDLAAFQVGSRRRGISKQTSSKVLGNSGGFL